MRLALLAVAVSAAGCGATAPRTTTAAPHAARVTPYTASLAFARCMRRHGAWHPDPDPSGDFHLTPVDERRMRTVPHAKREAASVACFRYLKPVVSTKPLSARAKRQAIVVLRQLKSCLHSYGYSAGAPVVRDLTLGRAMFGFDRPRFPPRATRESAGALPPPSTRASGVSTWRARSTGSSPRTASRTRRARRPRHPPAAVQGSRASSAGAG